MRENPGFLDPWRARLRGAVCRVLAAAATLCAVQAQAQSGGSTVTGIVRVRGASTGTSGVTVLLEGSAVQVRTDSLGRYRLSAVPPGPQVLVARRLGYAPSRTPITVPASGSLSVDLLIAASALELDQLIVTADRSGRAKGELGTASVIDRDAIANQIAASLQGVLELVPGTPLQPPGLDAAAQFSLRALAQTGTAGPGGASGPSAADIAASGTLIVLDGIPLSNNANLQSAGPRGETVPSASTAGGGIDLRRIPAATLERVEVIRGIPSARWGDLTQGAIVVDTRAAAVLPEVAGRYDPRTAEANVVGGRALRSDRQALTVTGNLAETRSARTLSSATTMRGAGQIAYRLQLGAAASAGCTRDCTPRFSMDTRFDWWQLKFDAPERPDIQVGRNSFQNDQGLRLGSRARLAIGGGVLEWTGALDRSEQLTRETRILSRPTTPFTDRLTEGRNIGSYVTGPYLAEYTLNGVPQLLYSRLEWDRRRSGTVMSQLRIGAEARREWNDGAGYQFDIARPPQASPFDGTAGYDRPRDFRTIAPLATTGAYVDARIAAKGLGMIFEVQPGLRLESLHERGWSDGVRSAQLQPRLNAQLVPASWFRLRGGVGVVSKAPTVAQLNPAMQYYDLVNVNRFTPDPRERLAVVTTFIRDPRNPDLGLSRARKQEFGFELDGGSRWGSLSAVWFDDRITGAVTLQRQPFALRRDRYALVDTGIGTGQPGRIVDPPISFDEIPLFLTRFANGGTLRSRGVEFTLALPVVPALRTRLEVNGAQITTDFTSDDRNFGPANLLGEFQVDARIPRVAYYEGLATQASRAIVTWRLVHHQPDLGLVITGTIQQRLKESRAVFSAPDSLSFAGFVSRDGTLTPVPRDQRGSPQYRDLVRQRPSAPSSRTTTPDDWVMTLQVAKSVFGGGRLAFYVYNVTDKFLTFGGGTVRALPSSRFGAEVTLPTAPLFRDRTS